MSRIGKIPVVIPKAVEVKIQDGQIIVKGPRGELRESLPPAIGASVSSGQVVVTADRKARKDAGALHGMARARIHNMVVGVVDGFSKQLEVIGLGFRAEVAGTKLSMALGKSHPVVFQVPPGLKVETDAKKILITVSGANKDLVGETAAKIRGLRRPEAYKGTGIRYKGEVVRKKAGKAAAGSTAGVGGAKK